MGLVIDHQLPAVILWPLLFVEMIILSVMLCTLSRCLLCMLPLYYYYRHKSTPVTTLSQKISILRPDLNS